MIILIQIEDERCDDLRSKHLSLFLNKLDVVALTDFISVNRLVVHYTNLSNIIELIANGLGPKSMSNEQTEKLSYFCNWSVVFKKNFRY